MSDRDDGDRTKRVLTRVFNRSVCESNHHQALSPHGVRDRHVLLRRSNSFFERDAWDHRKSITASHCWSPLRLWKWTVTSPSELTAMG